MHDIMSEPTVITVNQVKLCGVRSDIRKSTK